MLTLLLVSCLPAPATAQEPAPLPQYDCAALMLPYDFRMAPAKDLTGTVPTSARLPVGWVPVGGAWSQANSAYVIACRMK